jgi:hypothetical protein
VDRAVLIEVENLRRADVARLQEKYREVFGEPARSSHREHLFRRIAWQLQARAEGDLTERAVRRAAEIADDADLRKVAPTDFFQLEGERITTAPGAKSQQNVDRRMPLVGTLLSRRWKGRTILVEVLAQGFRYEGKPYSSLSAIAREVTGTRWNGMAFFGLTSAARKQRKERSRAEN